MGRIPYVAGGRVIGKSFCTTTARAAAFNGGDAVVFDGDFLAECIALDSYKALRRYITKHVAPGADARIRELCRLSAEERATKMLCDKRSLNDWAVALWTKDLEAHAFARHWHRRMQGCAGDSARWLVLNRDSISMEFRAKVPGGRLRTGQCEWLLGHATLAIMKHRFARARALALGMANAHMAELDDGLIGHSNLTMSGEALDSGNLQFTVQAEPVEGLLSPRAIRAKDERRRATTELLRQRVESLTTLCKGLCLRFTWRDGWGVAPSTAPDLASGAVIRRNRLFVEGHPSFILFATSGGYCARMVDWRLEVLDEQPWTAIDTLRHAYTRYRRLRETQSETLVASAPKAAEQSSDAGGRGLTA